MHFDDRLATVLRHRATGERAARTQFRQLLDLLGQQARGADESLEAAAYLRLDALGALVKAGERAEILAESTSRICNPALVEWFAAAEPRVAAAALGQASLPSAQWTALIPQLPIRARGFLRHRRDLPADVVELLDQLGVSDRALPEPVSSTEQPLELEVEAQAEDSSANETPDTPAPTAPARDEPREGIGALVRRIEQFTRAREDREAREEAPLLPLGDGASARGRKPLAGFAFGTDAQGRIDWADNDIVPMVVGMDLIHRSSPGTIAPGGAFAAAFFNRQPLRDAAITLEGADRIAGEWIVDAAPRFTPREGRFFGYVGRLRRPAESDPKSRALREAGRLRQLLHELRTPVNAIQGFAEVIQQQVFGPTPHEYRAIAASIAGDSARMLASFDELDRLAKLESGDLELEHGASDFAAITRAQVAQLQTVLSPRIARFEGDWPDCRAPIALTQRESEILAWRLLATIASATAAGEHLALGLESDGAQLAFTCVLPAALAAADDIFATDTRPMTGALSAGFLGAGFSLRLARAEARAAGGELARVDSRIVLTLPLLTTQESLPSADAAPDRAAG